MLCLLLVLEVIKEIGGYVFLDGAPRHLAVVYELLQEAKRVHRLLRQVLGFLPVLEPLRVLQWQDKVIMTHTHTHTTHTDVYNSFLIMTRKGVGLFFSTNVHTCVSLSVCLCYTQIVSCCVHVYVHSTQGMMVRV